MSQSRTYRPRIECLEGRLVPSTFLVKNLKDNGAGSLRQAISNANAPAHPDADTIVFKAGLQGTIKLTSGVIFISDSLVLAGPGAARITVNGNAQSGIFHVNDSTAVHKNVTIKGLTLFNGRAPYGGAINNFENLTLIKSVIRDNEGFILGGGLSSTGPQLTILASRLVKNNAFNGGGVHALEGKVLIKNSAIAGNSAGAFGGGLHAGSSVTDLTIANSKITGNEALSKGGGLYTLAALSTVKNTKIGANTATSSGGGLLSSGALEIDRSIISGNTSREGRGGGIRQVEGFLKLTSSTVRGNHADLSQGGGIFVNDTASGTSIRSCTIAGNTADAGGGVWSENSALAITRSVISGNTAQTGSGGGIALQFGYLRLTSSTLRGNHADGQSGGGILLTDITAASTIQGSTISANTAFGGGGLRVQNCPHPVLILSSTISANRATEDAGGISLSQNAPLTIQSCTIVFNEAGLNFSGGGIRAGATTVNLESSIVARNRAAVGPDLYSPSGLEPFFATFSLIGSTAESNFTGDATTNALIGRNPLLAPLAFNGGLTKTHALKAGSPAINKAGTVASSTFDQRGAPFKRKFGPAVDIGAFERQ